MAHTGIRDLFIAFARTGLVGFGGGPSMIPIIQHEVVRRYQWMSDTEFSDLLALANVLPGPIATKLPGYVGYRVAGIPGCLTAVLAITFPMIVAMILILSAFTAFRDIGWISGMALGVIPVVGVMMLQLTWEFLTKSRAAIGTWASVLFVLLGSVLLVGLGLHPAPLIIALLAAALLLPDAAVNRIKTVFRT